MKVLGHLSNPFSDSKKPLHPASVQEQAAWMSGDESHSSRLSAHDDARALVRLVQCTQCSKPFKVPVTLPCGHTVCRNCLPAPHVRKHITYPATRDRQRGIVCPIANCGYEHPLGECNVDVTLSKVIESIEIIVGRVASSTQNSLLVLEEILSNLQGPYTEEENDAGIQEPEAHTSRVLPGGRLVATYLFATEGQLRYTSEVAYRSLSSSGQEDEQLDRALLATLKEDTSERLECSVCYSVMHEPVTTSCGHTFCRMCLVRTLDHSQHCPWCRQALPIPPSLDRYPNNQRLVDLLQALCPETVAARQEAVESETAGAGHLNVPLFPCTLGFPSMPTFLHIFEPRYRLLIRRALADNGRFGMLPYNHAREPQGDLGVTEFMQYGVMLQIVNAQMMPDGRSLVETRGLSRFRVLEAGHLDGYRVGRIERVEDVSLAEEEHLEAEEITLSMNRPDSPMEGMRPRSQNGNGNGNGNNNNAPPPVESLTTQQLLMIGVEFILRMQANSAPWLRQQILDAYGGPPDDPALFPYWFATILPISEAERYQLLPTTSVRERLKMVVGWIRAAERQRWGGACTVL